jgi:dTDP-4-dehydrorhamnose 3,5-epimerase-like enzyme
MPKAVSTAFTFAYNDTPFAVYHANKFEGLMRHQHSFEHAVICYNGSCSVRVWKGSDMFERVCNKSTGALVLPPDLFHEIVALEDNTVFVNMYSKNNYQTDNKKIQNFFI